MSAAPAARLALALFGGLLVTLLLALALLLARDDARALPVPLLRLTPAGPEHLSLPGPTLADAYAGLLQPAGADGWLERSWRRLRRHGPLRDAQLAAEAGDLAAARSHLERQALRDPADLDALWRQLELLAALGEPAAVVELAGTLLLAAPGFGPALLRRARAREAAGDRLGALVDLAAALERPLGERDFAAAASAQLQLLADLGHGAEALSLAERLGPTLPASAADAAALGQAAHALGAYDKAAQQFRLALARGGEPALQLALARSLSALERDAEALELLLATRFVEEAEEAERRRLLSRLAGRLALAELALLSAEEALALSDDPVLRLELAQRLLDERPADPAAAERALLVLTGGEASPCRAQASPDLRRCRRLAAEALRRSGRPAEAAMLLRAAFAATDDLALLAELAMTLLALQQPLPAGRLLAGLGTAAGDAATLTQAAEAYLQGSRPDLSLALLDELPAPERPARAEALEIVAAQQASDWPRLLRLLAARPRLDDGLPAAPAEADTYCRALAELERPALRGCIETLARRRPADAGLQYHAADLARRVGDTAAAAVWLERAVAQRRDGRWLLELGFLLQELERHDEAERRFEAAEAAGAGPQATLARGYALLRRGRRGAAAHLLRRALEQPELAREERVTALLTLAGLLGEVEAHGAAAQALAAAAALDQDPRLLLQLARAQQRAGAPLLAAATLAGVASEALAAPDAARRFDLLGDLARTEGDRHGEVAARRGALALAPTAGRQELLASALLRRGFEGDVEAARESLAAAIALNGLDNPRLLARLAYLDRAAGDLERAERLLFEAMLRAPRILEYREDLALLLAESGRQEEGLALLRVALDAAQEHPRAGEPDRRAQELKLRALHAGLSRRWRARLEESLCLGRASACRRAALLASESQVGQGLAEVGFRPLPDQAWGRLELIARLNWDRAAGRLAPRRRFAQGALGFRLQPLAGRDLWLGAERLQALGSGGRDAWRLHLAYRAAHGLDWHYGDRELRPFASFYGELSRFLGAGGEATAVAEARAGLRGQWGERFAYLPFLYLAGGRETLPGQRLLRLEAGIGLAGSWRVGHHRYDGHLGELGLSLRFGQERDSLGRRSTRGQLGLALRY